MSIGREFLKAVLVFAIFLAVWWIMNLIMGDGFSGEDARTAVISGLIFTLLYSVGTYFYRKRKLNT